VPVVLIDTFPGALDEARAAGIPVLQAEILSNHGEEQLSGHAVDYLLAATPDEIYNGLVCARLMPELGRQRVFQLAPPGGRLDQRRGLNRDSRGRILGDPPIDYATLAARFAAGWRFAVGPGDGAGDPLLVLRASGALTLVTTEDGEPAEDGAPVVWQAAPAQAADIVTAEAPPVPA
jgi:hypothetical protein